MTSRVGEVVVRQHGNVVEAVLDRPERRNCIDVGIIEGLEHAVRLATADATVLQIRGAGGHFCAGADLDLVRGLMSDRAALEGYVRRLSDVLDSIEAGPFTSVAVVEGFAVAGGCELLLSCDVVVADSAARIGDRHLEHGLLPGAGGSVRLVRSLPRTRARWLLLSGEMISGDLAAEWGLATFAFPSEELEGEVAALVRRLASRDRAALDAVRIMARSAEAWPCEAALIRERHIFLDHITTSAHVRERLDGFVRRTSQ